MRVLHVVKTADGADWAAAQATELVKLGVEVHVALPRAQGRTVQKWVDGGAVVHIASTDLPIRSPWPLPATMRRLRDLVSSVRPDLIHSHFFGSTVLLRLALGANHGIPRLFQVPGPLHLEHWFWRTVELSTAGPCDSWVATSRATLSHYLRAGVSRERVFLSYAGTENKRFRGQRTGWLRRHLGLAHSEFLVGNISYIYSPKWYMLQRVGLKCHEDLIEGISLAAEKDRSIRGVLIGGPWGTDSTYYEKLRRYARKQSGNAVIMPGPFNQEEVASAIGDFDCAAHVPMSENCGGAVEPLLCGIPTITSRVGGLVEVVKDGWTGVTVPVHDPSALSQAILQVRNHYGSMCKQAHAGRLLVQTMFDVNRTALEVEEIYRYVLGQRASAPGEFNSEEFLKATSAVV